METDLVTVDIINSYKSFRFGNIKQSDRQRYFPIDQIQPYTIPWQYEKKKMDWTMIFPTKAPKQQHQSLQKQQQRHQDQQPQLQPRQRHHPQQQRQNVVPRGLMNHGNMCFMNSILQPLVHCPLFYDFIMSCQIDMSTPTPILAAMYILLTIGLDSVKNFKRE
jgi:uncharacterized UBP type Zn finger protein